WTARMDEKHFESGSSPSEHKQPRASLCHCNRLRQSLENEARLAAAPSWRVPDMKHFHSLSEDRKAPATNNAGQTARARYHSKNDSLRPFPLRCSYIYIWFERQNGSHDHHLTGQTLQAFNPFLSNLCWARSWQWRPICGITNT